MGRGEGAPRTPGGSLGRRRAGSGRNKPGGALALRARRVQHQQGTRVLTRTLLRVLPCQQWAPAEPRAALAPISEGWRCPGGSLASVRAGSGGNAICRSPVTGAEMPGLFPHLRAALPSLGGASPEVRVWRPPGGACSPADVHGVQLLRWRLLAPPGNAGPRRTERLTGCLCSSSSRPWPREDHLLAAGIAAEDHIGVQQAAELAQEVQGKRCVAARVA